MTFVPASTYRLQLGMQMTFERVRDLVPYLERLGVGAAYTSPVLRACAASTHGYDVTDPTRLDPKLGDGPAFLAMSRALHRRGLGLILDIAQPHGDGDGEPVVDGRPRARPGVPVRPVLRHRLVGDRCGREGPDAHPRTTLRRGRRGR